MMRCFLLLFVLFCFQACNNESADTHGRQQQQVETPAALEESKINLKSYGRGGYSLVDDLYSELAEENTSLKNLEKNLDDYEDKPGELKRDFLNYNNKSQDYYVSAKRKSGAIQDSVLKQEIIRIIELSHNKYDNRTKALTAIMEKIDKNNIAITDYHNALKIVKTLPIIEQYQQDKLPDEKAYQQLIKEQEQLLKELKNLRK